MFKEVTVAWETLGDEDKRRAYDRQFSRSNSLAQSGQRQGSKDRRSSYESRSRAPTSKSQPFTTPPSTAQGTSHPSSQGPSASYQQQAPNPGVKIPDDLMSLTAKELKELLTALGIRHDDCVEKSDLITRLNSRRKTGDRYNKENVAPDGTQFPNNNVRIKIITAGCAGVGKSCLVKRFCEGRFVTRYITTIGVDYGVKVVPNVFKHTCKVNFFDLSGQDDFKDIRIDFYRDGQGVLLCYDCTNQQSFRTLPQWMFESRVNGLDLENSKVVVALCATKIDAQGRQVSRAEGQAFAQSKGFLYFEVSSQSGENVNETLNTVFEHVVGKQLEARKKLGL